MAYMFIKITAPNISMQDMNEKVTVTGGSATGLINFLGAIEGGFISAQVDVTVRDTDTAIPAATGTGVVTTLPDL